MPRFSLAGVFAVVAFVAFGCAALLHSNMLWRQITLTAVLAILTGAILAAVAVQHTGRWFWFGFALTGWLYLGLAFYGGWIRPVLLTHSALDFAHTRLGIGETPLTPAGDRVDVDIVGGRVATGPPGPFTAGATYREMTIEEAEAEGLLQYAYDPNTSPKPEYFFEIGHFLWALILGCVAGVFTYWLRKRESSEPPPRPGT